MRALLCSLDAPGMLYPMLYLGQELRAAGHDVAVLTSGTQTTTVQDSGLRCLPPPPDDEVSFHTPVWAKPSSGALQLKRIAQAVQIFDPDVLVGQMLTLGSYLAAEYFDLPLAVLGMATYLWPRSHSHLDSLDEEAAYRLKWRFDEMMSLYNKTRASLRIATRDGTYASHPLLGDAFLVRNIEALEVDPEPLPDPVHCVGPLLARAPTSTPKDLSDWLALPPPAPIAYVQPGHYFNRPDPWAALTEAVDTLNLSVAASMGRFDREATLPSPPHYIADYVPIEHVLPSASVMISTGHTTSVLGAWTHGVPSLLIPSGSGSEDIAQRCADLGMAIVISPEAVTPDRISSALSDLCNEALYRTRAAEVESAFQPDDYGFDRAIAVIESLVSVPAATTTADV